MEYLIICFAALFASGLTLFSGFGLATLLMPCFALFFPVDLAIALTAIVHFLNNIFKLYLLGKHADKRVVLLFGLTAIVFAFFGALSLTFIAGLKPVAEFSLWGKAFQITPLKLTIAILIFIFALIDILPRLSHISFNKKYLPLGGILSGFIGGVSGNQGALRTAFLIRANLSKEAFIATGIVIACLTDISRLSVYVPQIVKVHSDINYTLLGSATLSAFLGAYLGNKLIKKVTIRGLQIFVGYMLMVFSIALGMGIL